MLALAALTLGAAQDGSFALRPHGIPSSMTDETTGMIQTHVHAAGVTTLQSAPSPPIHVDCSQLLTDLPSMLGQAPSPGWSLYEITTYNIHGNDQDWFDAADVFGEFHVTTPGNSGCGSATTFNNMYRSYDRLDNQNSGNLNLYLLVPQTSTQLELRLMEYDSISSNDLIGSNNLPAAGCNAGSSCTINLNRGTESFNCNWLGFSCSTRPASQATLTYQVFSGSALEPRLAAVKALNKHITEPRNDLTDPSSASSYWSRIRYYGSQVGYIWNGMFGDSSGTPVSGLWAYLSEGSHSGGTMVPGPGAGTTSIIGHALGKQALLSWMPALQRHDRTRGNELGIQLLNDQLWPEKPTKEGIALGDDNNDHGVMRPILDRLVGPGMATDPLIKDKVRQAAEAFMAGNTFETGTSFKVWTTKLLHEFHLGMILTDAEASDFASRMGTFLYTSFLPRELAISAFTGSMQTWKAGRITAYKAALSTHLPEWSTYTEQQKTAIASATLDSLIFAGGVSVPTVLKNAFAILYGHYGAAQLGSNFRLREAQILPFVMEVVRRFPPVAGFPTWDRAANVHTVVNVLMASSDESPDAWGPTARSFVLRPMSTYHDHSIAWADFAMVNNDNAHPFSHSCPAKDLSVMMVVELLRVWVKSGGKNCWTAGTPTASINVNCYRTTVFTLTNTCSTPPPIQCADSRADSSCPQDNMVQHSHPCADADAVMRVGPSSLPTSMQGIFWLSNQRDSSAVMSFAESNDGGGYSTGSVAAQPDGTGRYIVRVGGDRVWSFADLSNNHQLANLLDLVYHFEFNSASNPTFAQIYPAADNLLSLRVDAVALLNFTMSLMTNHPTYPNSQVWARDSAVAGQNLASRYYELIQVVDAAGNRLEPAWSDFVSYCGRPVAGTTPGTLFYRQATPPPQVPQSLRVRLADTDNGFWARTQRLFDSRFDTYTRLIVRLTNSQPWTRPTAINVTVPTTRETVPLVPLPNVAGVEVPRTDEHWPDVSEMVSMGTSMLGMLPFPDTAAECGEYGTGENPMQLILSHVQRYPYNRVLTPWGADRFSDQAVEDLIFNGVGAHRIERIRPGDNWAGTVGAYYAVYLGFTSTLEVKPGFARLGADAYFDRNGRILGILRGGRMWRPTDFIGTERTCSGYLFWRSCSYNLGWRHAKLAFRGTLSAIVTLVDHLYGIHFTVGNALVTANVRELEPDHPIRRLLTPFGFRTEAINYQASVLLSPDYHLVHRAASLTHNGMAGAYAYANSSSRLIRWSTVAYKIRTRGDTVDTFTLPMDEDGSDFYTIMNRFVRSYLLTHYDYAANTCGSDAGIQRWYARANTVLPNYDLPMPITCENLEEVLSVMMYLVSAMHQHVGTIGAEVEDPCFAPWAWREGDVCGPPRSFFTQSAIMLSTSKEQPRILEDYTHMFDDQASKQLWRNLVTDLTALNGTVASRNLNRRRPFRSFQTSTMETGVSI